MLSKLRLPLILSVLLLWSSLQAQDFERFWAGAEFLYWKIQNSKETVPLVVEGSTVRPVLGQPGTSVVLGGKNIHNDFRVGERFNLGFWLDCNCCYGTEANYFFLPSRTHRHSVCSSGLPGSPFLAAPFFDVTQSIESSESIASSVSSISPFSGKAVLKLKNSMQGAELNGFVNLPGCCEFGLSILGGFRYWNFNETLTFDTNSPYLNISDVYRTRDRFGVMNSFYGGQLGISANYLCDCFSVELKGKVALGATWERLHIQGFLLTNDFDGFGEVQKFEGGYFALPSNIGHFERSEFAVLPEVSINFGYQALSCLRIQVGYSFFYVSNMLYAGRQIDRNINPSQSIAAPLDPRPRLKTDSLWVQGLNAGIEISF